MQECLGFPCMRQNVVSMKALIRPGQYFYVSHWRQDHHFTWLSEPREGINSPALQGKDRTFISQLLLRP